MFGLESLHTSSQTGRRGLKPTGSKRNKKTRPASSSRYHHVERQGYMIGKIYDSTPSRNSGCDNLAQCQNSKRQLLLYTSCKSRGATATVGIEGYRKVGGEMAESSHQRKKDWLRHRRRGREGTLVPRSLTRRLLCRGKNKGRIAVC